MPKRNKKTRNKPPVKNAPRQQRTIENMSSEELALLLGEQYKMIMQSQNNIAAINGVLEQRRRQLASTKKETTDGNPGN